jgi:hypothetical protein
MGFFVFTGIEIKIKVSKQLMSLIIFNLENSYVWVPDLHILQLFEV